MCFLIALVLTFFVYNTLKKSVQPEATTKIAYFKSDLESGSIIKELDVVLRETPISLVPKNAINNIADIKDKMLLSDATAGDFILASNIAARGDIKVDVQDMFYLGIEVDKISNFIGTQLKEGEYYGLLFIGADGNSEKMYKIKLVNMIDNTGKIVVEGSQSVVSEINVAVEEITEVREIAEKKRAGSFELVRVPESKWEEIQELNNDYNNNLTDIEENVEEQITD